MPFGQLNVITLIYNMCKGRLGSRGERGCISEQTSTSDKNRPLCKMVIFIVHQLGKCPESGLQCGILIRVKSGNFGYQVNSDSGLVVWYIF